MSLITPLGLVNYESSYDANNIMVKPWDYNLLMNYSSATDLDKKNNTEINNLGRYTNCGNSDVELEY